VYAARWPWWRGRTCSGISCSIGFPGSYYEQRFALPPDLGGEVAYLTRSPLTCTAQAPEEIGTITPDHGHFDGKQIYLYRTIAACLPPQ